MPADAEPVCPEEPAAALVVTEPIPLVDIMNRTPPPPTYPEEPVTPVPPEVAVPPAPPAPPG